MTYPDLLLRLADLVLVGCLAWAVLLVVATVVEAATAARVPALVWVAAPPAVRRALLGLLGVALVGATPGPVGAAVLGTTTHRPGGIAAPARPVDPPAGRARPEGVVVRHGDTLWALARARLPVGSGDATVAADVRRWHALNRAVIGPDPDLILPGQRLRAPHREEHR